MTRSYKDTFDEASRLITDHQKKYESIEGFYRRAAVTASHKLNREVSEYDIILVEMSVIESKIALNRTDFESYARLAVLSSLAAQFSTIKSENYAGTNLVDVTETIKMSMESELETDSAAALASKLAPLGIDLPPSWKVKSKKEDDIGTAI